MGMPSNLGIIFGHYVLDEMIFFYFMIQPNISAQNTKFFILSFNITFTFILMLKYTYNRIIPILTASDKIVITNAQAAKNHCTLHTDNGSSIPANNTIVEHGIKILVINKSARATFTIKVFPVK